MITKAEEDALLASIRSIADREYRRGLEDGWNIAKVAINWLRMKPVSKSKPSYTQEQIATMIETRLKEEAKRVGVAYRQ